MVNGDDVMRWFRFSIAGVMVLIVYAAIGFAAFAKVDDPWYGRVLDDAYFMVTVFILATATILAVIRRGHAQAIWVGFAIFGWTHLNYGWPDAGASAASTDCYQRGIRWHLSTAFPAYDDDSLEDKRLCVFQGKRKSVAFQLHMARVAVNGDDGYRLDRSIIR